MYRSASKWPIPENRWAYFGWLITACFVNVPIVNSSGVELTVSVCIAELAFECVESTLLVKLQLLYQSLKMGQWYEVKPKA